MKKHLSFSVVVLSCLILGTIAIVLYGKGYRIGFGQGRPEVSGTGLLVATSQPDGAQVFVNDHLTTATNNTINLIPGSYKVKIFKDGYFPWQKDLVVNKEVVTKAAATLFPTTPKLESITATGVQDPIMDPTFTRIAYTVASQSARKNGVYVLDISNRPVLTLQSSATQIADDTADLFSTAKLSWSPDGKQLLATISSDLRLPTTYLLQANSLNDAPQDVTNTIQTVQQAWEAEKTEKQAARLAGFKPLLRTMITQYFTPLAWSPDETKIMYVASDSATLPVLISPRLLGITTDHEVRDIKKGTIYVYDIKEDTNFALLSGVEANLADASNAAKLTWFPDSEHVIVTKDKRIGIMEADGSNLTTIYAGPFTGHYVFPWSDGSRIVMLTNLGNPDLIPNLYTIGLK
jgi:hypothetical protein